MDKPLSMPVKDYLVKVLSIKTNTSSSTIDAIISHQFEQVNLALQSNYTIEVSGFGKFIFNYKKAIKKMEKNIMKKEYWETLLLSPELTEQKRKSVQLKLENTLKFIEGLKPKLEKWESLKSI